MTEETADAVTTQPGKHTPGPWRWFGNQHGIYLATPHDGRRYVMDFVRHGMHGAQPRFQPTCGMVNASELVMFAVGDPSVRGFANAKADPTVYRYDIRGIDCPDARLIAAAPELLEACKAVLHALVKRAEADGSIDWIDPPYQAAAVHESAIERLQNVINEAQQEVTQEDEF